MQCNRIESGVQLFSRINHKPLFEDINPILFPEGGPSANQVIEITGDPQVDKNDLIIDFVVKCILPQKYNNEWKDSVAILINTEFQISLLKIIKVIETLIIKHKISDNKKEIIENALKNLIIFNCYNIEELEITIYYLEKIIQCNDKISLVVIDNIAAHFWVSPFNSEMRSYFHHSLKMFEKLHNVLKNLQILIVFARHEKINKRKFSNKIDYRIELERIASHYKATVTNYEKETIVYVPFQLNTIIEYL